jgi:RNA polymerase sigma-70 factor (sigma-E family)
VEITGRVGDDESFAVFVDRYADELLRHATIISADPSLARDLVQTVLARLLNQWERRHQIDNLNAYARRMVVNEFLSVRRRLKRITLTAASVEPAPFADHAGAVSDRLTLLAALRDLPPRQRACLALRYWHDMPDAQIATELGVAEATVRSCIHRALRKLRITLNDEPATTGWIARKEHS